MLLIITITKLYYWEVIKVVAINHIRMWFMRKSVNRDHLFTNLMWQHIGITH